MDEIQWTKIDDNVSFGAVIDQSPRDTISATVSLTLSVYARFTNTVPVGATFTVRGTGLFNVPQAQVSRTGARYGDSTVTLLYRASIASVPVDGKIYTQTIFASLGEQEFVHNTSHKVAPITRVLEPITNVTMTIQNGTPVVTWRSGSDASLYSKVVVRTRVGINDSFAEIGPVVRTQVLAPNATAVVSAYSDTDYVRVEIQGSNADGSVVSPVGYVTFRNPLVEVTGVTSRISRNGILVEWTDPNLEHTAKSLQYRIFVESGEYSQVVPVTTDQRRYYFANLQPGRKYRFAVAIVDPVSGETVARSALSAETYLPRTYNNGGSVYDYRVGSTSIDKVFIGNQMVWSRI